MSYDNNTVFLDVDLDVQMSSGLEALLGSIGSDVIVLHKGSSNASVELNRDVSSPEEAILGLVALVEALPADVRRLWDQANQRSVSIGIQAGSQPHSTVFAISRECIAKLAEVGAEAIFTVYAARAASDR